MANTTITQWIKANYKNFEGDEKLLIENASKVFKNRRNVTTAFYKLKQTKWWEMNSAKTKNDVSKEAPQKIFLTEGDIDERHDPYFKLRNAAKTLKKGQFIEDSNFRDYIVKLSVNEYRRPSDNAEFDKFKMKCGGKTYWGHPESISAKKREGLYK